MGLMLVIFWEKQKEMEFMNNSDKWILKVSFHYYQQIPVLQGMARCYEHKEA